MDHIPAHPGIDHMHKTQYIDANMVSSECRDCNVERESSECASVRVSSVQSSELRVD